MSTIGMLPELDALREQFKPPIGAIPDGVVELTPLSVYNELSNLRQGDVA
jgi:hypothetical protein